MSGHTHFSFTLSQPGLAKQACGDGIRFYEAGSGRPGRSYKNTVLCARSGLMAKGGRGAGQNRDTECGSMVEVYKVITLI